MKKIAFSFAMLCVTTGLLLRPATGWALIAPDDPKYANPSEAPPGPIGEEHPRVLPGGDLPDARPEAGSEDDPSALPRPVDNRGQ